VVSSPPPLSELGVDDGASTTASTAVYVVREVRALVPGNVLIGTGTGARFASAG
jgi:hypothetical protein